MEPSTRNHYTQSADTHPNGAGVQVVLGAALIVIFWWIAWAGVGPLRHHTFTPLWIGYILTVDGLSRVTSGTSLLSRMRWRSLYLFGISVPFWWIFEAANLRLQNWNYLLPHDYSWFRYRLEASIAFSTVVPAVFVTAELVRSTLIPRPMTWIHFVLSRSSLVALSASGALMFMAVMTWPSVLFPLVWISLFLAMDPLAYLVGGRSITAQVREGRWDTVLVLFTATVVCGFFWELWNWRSMPKWEYAIPYAEWLHLFEMPALGYGGYFPFGLELFAFVNLIDRLLRLNIGSDFRFDRSGCEC